MQRSRDEEVIVVSDDEITTVASPQLVYSSFDNASKAILEDKLPSDFSKGLVPDGPTESSNSNISENILDPFPSRIFNSISKDILEPFPSGIFTDESPLSSQEHGGDMLDNDGLPSEIKSSVGRNAASLTHSKGPDRERKISSMNNASNTVTSLKDVNSNCKDSFGKPIKHHSSTRTVCSKALKHDLKAQKADSLIMELISDGIDDPLEHALDNSRRPQSLLTKPIPNVPKRKVIQLQMPTNDKSGFLNRTGAGSRRLKPPRLDDWYRPILELDYFGVVGLSSSKDEKSTPSVNLKEVPLCFQSVEHYVDIFRPLVLEEFKAQLHNSHIEAPPDDILCGSLSVLSVERIDDFHILRGRPDECESAASKGWLENDLVLLTKQPLKNSVQDVHVLGKVSSLLGLLHFLLLFCPYFL